MRVNTLLLFEYKASHNFFPCIVMRENQSVKFTFPILPQKCECEVKFPAGLWLPYFLHRGRCLAEWRCCQEVLFACHILCPCFENL